MVWAPSLPDNLHFLGSSQVKVFRRKENQEFPLATAFSVLQVPSPLMFSRPLLTFMLALGEFSLFFSLCLSLCLSLSLSLSLSFT
jgi:hypothetical protein